MSTYTDKDFEELKQLTEENNKILRVLKRRSNTSVIFTFVKWLIIIGIAIGAFTLLKPILQQVVDTYQAISVGVYQINETKDSLAELKLTEFIDLIKSQ